MKNLLYVIAKGGPAIEYALPKLTKRAQVFAVALSELNEHAKTVLRQNHVEPLPCPSMKGGYEGLFEEITAKARSCGADAVITFSEFALCVVADACSKLGLKGPGPNVEAARNKILMRQKWQDAGVAVPRFVPVRFPGDLAKVRGALTFPILLKSAWGAGSVGQEIVPGPDDLEATLERLNQVNRRAQQGGFIEYRLNHDCFEYIAEEIIQSSTESWYDRQGYGDYLSVEGLVVGGRYHPVCITARFPTIPPFTEMSNQAPCTLPEHLQRIIEGHARKAVEALGLDTCGTHTEIKLMRDRQLCFLETAARLPGAMVCREVEDVFGVDMIDALACALLGDAPALPSSMLVEPVGGAAASVALIATNAKGRPWRQLPLFVVEKINWTNLISGGSRAEVVAGQSLPSGSPMPMYDGASGVLNFAGLLYLRARDSIALRNDTYAVLDHLEQELTRPASRVTEDLRFTSDLPPVGDVVQLCKDAKLNGPLNEPARFEAMLKNAQYNEFAYHGARLVGFIRVLTDFAYNAFIADLAVSPDYNRKGIGSELMHRAIARYPGVKFILHAGGHSEEFYKKIGFTDASGCLVFMRRF